MPTTVTIPLADLPPGAIKQIQIDGKKVAVANAGGEIYAVSDTCTHARIPLSGGCLEGRQIICPWHHAMFDLKTGRATCGPARDPLVTYPVKIENGAITVHSATA